MNKVLSIKGHFILGRPKAGRDLRLRFQPKRIGCKKFGDQFPTKKYAVKIFHPRSNLAKYLGTRLPPKSMLSRFFVLQWILQKIWGPVSHQKVCCQDFHPRCDFAKNLGTSFPPKSMLS